MAWAFVSVGAFNHAYATDPSVTPAAPSGSGGILLLLGSTREGTITAWNTPTGWTLIASSLTYRNAVFARVSDGGANDSPSLSVSGTTSLTACVSRWTGGNTTLASLLNGSLQTLYGATPGGIDVPGITPSVDNCLVIRGGVTKWDDGPYTGVPSGDTFLAEDDWNQGGGSNQWAAWCYRIQTTAGAVSSGQIDNGTTSADSYGIAVALTEQAGGPLVLPTYDRMFRQNTLLRM